MSFRLIKDSYPTFLHSGEQVLPTFQSTNLPPNLIAGVGGGLGYDRITKRVYYNNGDLWVPLQAAGGGGGQVFSYSFVLDSNIVVFPATNTIISGWTIPNSPPFYDNTGTGWNLITGIYTATDPQTFSMNVDLSWESGSNLGNRTVTIIYKPVAGLPQIVKSATTQANPDSNVSTNQTVTTFIDMVPGDTAWVEVSHTAPIPLSVSGLAPMPQTTVCGVRINPP